MPYVSESSEFDGGTFSYGRSGQTVYLPHGRLRQQIGFRSGAGVPSEAPPEQPTHVYGPTTRHTLDIVDGNHAYFVGRASDGWAEHDRTYNETYLSIPTTVGFSCRRVGQDPETPDLDIGNILVAPASVNFQLTVPTDAVVKRTAESLARSTVPDRPYVNVTRALGEMKDAPQLFAIANWKPSSLSDLGGAYLNQVFGTQPTVGDMQRIAEAANMVVPKIREEVSRSSQTLHRSATRYFDREFRTGIGVTTSSANPASIGNAKYFAASVRGMASYGPRLISGYSSSESVSVRSYGRYTRIVTRIDRTHVGIQPKLESLLGSGLSGDVIYDLTPYSWLLNWAWDFGSLLRYQESLNGADVVARAHGFTLRHEKQGGSTISFEDGSFGAKLTSHSSGAVTARRSYVRRMGGTSPYSLTTGSWDSLNGSQWAVLTALGLARSAGVPRIRGM